MNVMQEFLNGSRVGLDIAPAADKSVLNIWLVGTDESTELLYSEDYYKLRSNFADYCKRKGIELGCFMVDVAKYGELKYMMQQCFTQDGKQYKTYSDKWGNVIVAADVELTDEQKFICALLCCDAKDYGLTSKILASMYGWTKYKSRKVARSVQHKRVETLLSEDCVGYFGKGWLLERAMHTAVSDYVRQRAKRSKSGA